MARISINITLEQISGLLTSALEGGSNYWIVLIHTIEPTNWTFTSDLERESGHWLQDYPLNEGGALLIGIEDDDVALRLDSSAIERGLNLMAENSPQHFADVIASNDDAETGDVFLQYCLFGEIIYG